MRLLPLLLLCACGSASRDARVLGRVDIPGAVRIEAVSDDGGVVHSTGIENFELIVGLQQVWSLRVVTESDVIPVAFAREGHFDRGLFVQSNVDANVGVVALSVRDVGIEPLVSCADGPPLPTVSLLLSNVPERHALTTVVPPPILRECAPTPLP